MDTFHHPIVPRLVLAVGAVIATAALPAEPAHTQQRVELEEIIVSAGRTPLSAQLLGRAHTVITRDDLQGKQVRTVAEALELVPGLSVGRAGGTAATTQIRMRGAEGNHVLVLLDGIEISDPSHGEFYWEALPVSSIERIEVIRGPQSTLWGSNALAGVISITTTSDAATPPQAFLELGQRDSVSASAETGLQSSRARARLSVGYYSTDGNDISGVGSELDGASSVTPAASLTAELSDAVTFSANLRYLRRKTDSDPSNPDFNDPNRTVLVDSSTESLRRREWFGAIQLPIHQPGSRVRITPRVEHTQMDRVAYSASFPSAWRSSRTHASTQVDVALADGATPDTAKTLLSMAGEWEQVVNRSCTTGCTINSPQFRKHQRTLRGLAGELRTEIHGMHWQVGARYDANEEFQNARTWSAAVSIPLAEHGARLHASIGTAVTNPTLSEQFSLYPSAFSNFRGNPNLHPEKSLGWDFGVERTIGGIATVEVTLFGERLEDEINGFAVDPSNPGDRTAINEDGTSRRQGLELSLAWNPISDLDLEASYTYTDSKDPDGEWEVRRPRHQASLHVEETLLHPDHRGFVTLTYTGTQQDSDFRSFPSAVVELSPTLLTTVGGTVQLDAGTQILWRVENLFDEEVQPVFGYFGSGRQAFIGLRKQF